MKVSKTAQSLGNALGREPTVREIADAAGLEPEEVAEAICVMQPSVSLTHDTDDGERTEDIPVEAPDVKITDSIALSQALSELDGRDRALIYLRYFGGLTQQQRALADCRNGIRAVFVPGQIGGDGIPDLFFCPFDIQFIHLPHKVYHDFPARCNAIHNTFVKCLTNS